MHVSTRRARFASLLTLAALVFGLAAPQPALAQGADQEFRNGVAAFEQGRFEEAEQHFRNVLKSQPDHEQAVRYRDEAGYRFWVQVLARGGRLATVAKRILKAAEKGALRERQDEEQLREDLRGLWSDDFMVEIETVEKLVAKYGHYVVPEVVDVLADRHEDEKRVRVISLLTRLADEGTLAVIELLESDDITLQQNAAAVLGHTKDVRAVPALKRCAEQSSDRYVKEACNKAVSRIEGPDFGTADYYARVAEAFYQENPLFLINRYKEYVVWKWADGRLTRRDVPRWRWNEEVAEEMAYDGLSVEPDSTALWAGLLCAYAQEWTEIEETLRVAQIAQDRGAEVDEEELEQMRTLQTGLAKVKMLVASRGAEGVLAALGKAMRDQRAPVAVFLIERLQELKLDGAMLGTGGPETYLPPAERDEAAAPAPAATPAPTPKPTPANTGSGNSGSGDSGNSGSSGDDDDAPPLDDDDDDDDAPPLDDDDDDDDSGSGRRRPRRVSQAPKTSERTTRLAFRGPGIAPQVVSAANDLEAGSPDAEILTGGAALTAALGYGDKRVRYAAAIALAHLNPAEEFSNLEKVMENLIDALGESGQRVVLVVERDRANRNYLVGLLRELGYMAFGVESGRDGLVRAKSFPGEDLVIVSSELNPDGSGSDPIEFQFIDELKNDYRTAPIKVMILTPEERVSEMQTLVDEERALDVLTPRIDKATLSDKLTRAFGNPEDQRDEKARSDAIAERAAKAIAQLQMGHTKFDIASAATALATNVRRDTGRPDSVRLACLEALSAIGPAAKGAALEVCIREFRDTTNSVEVRRALATAAGDVVKGSTISGDTFQVLKAALAEGDEGVWKAAGYALGKAQLTGAQAVEVFNEQRIE